MLKILLLAGVMFACIGIISLANFIHRTVEYMGYNKRFLLIAIISFVLAASFVAVGMINFKYCNNCGYEYYKKEMPNYCKECGHALTEDSAKRFECTCGKVYYSDSREKFCPDCGTKIDYAANTNFTEETVKEFECECGMVYHANGGEKFCKDCGTKIVYE